MGSHGRAELSEAALPWDREAAARLSCTPGNQPSLCERLEGEGEGGGGEGRGGVGRGGQRREGEVSVCVCYALGAGFSDAHLSILSPSLPTQ